MKQIVSRLRNAASNVQTDHANTTGADPYTDPYQCAEDIHKIADALEAYIPPGLTKAEYDDINALHKLFERHGAGGDGLDKELSEHIQAIQKLLMLRGGSRCWAYIKSENPQAYGPYNQ